MFSLVAIGWGSAITGVYSTTNSQGEQRDFVRLGEKGAIAKKYI
ncbi:hypothetical protein [Nostoc mirabile]|nr:hypothetical protein [Nostoc mirabile]